MLKLSVKLEWFLKLIQKTNVCFVGCCSLSYISLRYLKTRAPVQRKMLSSSVIPVKSHSFTNSLPDLSGTYLVTIEASIGSSWSIPRVQCASVELYNPIVELYEPAGSLTQPNSIPTPNLPSTITPSQPTVSLNQTPPSQTPTKPSQTNAPTEAAAAATPAGEPPIFKSPVQAIPVQVQQQPLRVPADTSSNIIAPGSPLFRNSSTTDFTSYLNWIKTPAECVLQFTSNSYRSTLF